MAVTGDIKKAFLQVRIREEDRDALRFHWFKDLHTKTIEVLGFTRALFGLSPLPFLLRGVIKHHLNIHREMYPELVTEIERSLYVNDLIGGGTDVVEASRLKRGATDVFASAKFELHKWNSNVCELETPSTQIDEGDESETFAKQQLEVPASVEASILGLPWHNEIIRWE